MIFGIFKMKIPIIGEMAILVQCRNSYSIMENKGLVIYQQQVLTK